MITDEVLHSTGTASRKLELSPERIRQLCDTGELPFVRDAGGRRLITESALRDLRERRIRAKEKRT